jgi:hypothetical protein
MASGATILSAGINPNAIQAQIDALVWALDQSTEVINYSGGLCTNDTLMTSTDRAFDYYVRSRFRLIVVASGNSTKCGNFNVASPAKAWNVLAVGAYDDHNNDDWADDVGVANFSNWIDPSTPYGHFEKPDVVAPGVQVVGVGMNGNLVTNYADNSGTSFSAPQVSGLAALLIQRNAELKYWPEGTRAIIMATANHNIEGPTGLTGNDLKDGAGGINADLADITAANRGQSNTTCANPCWWGETIYSSSFPVGTYIFRSFTAQQYDRIRVAIAWDSNADCSSISSCNFSRLDTDLNFGILDPNWNWIAWAGGVAGSSELVPADGKLVVPTTGTYTIAIYNARMDESYNYLGIAVTRFTENVYIPLVIR